jgi:hypothetical protein
MITGDISGIAMDFGALLLFDAIMLAIASVSFKRIIE